jgi:hypothetical protein
VEALRGLEGEGILDAMILPAMLRFEEYLL